MLFMQQDGAGCQLMENRHNVVTRSSNNNPYNVISSAQHTVHCSTGLGACVYPSDPNLFPTIPYLLKIGIIMILISLILILVQTRAHFEQLTLLIFLARSVNIALVAGNHLTHGVTDELLPDNR
jgi:hypothetical protein